VGVGSTPFRLGHQNVTYDSSVLHLLRGKPVPKGRCGPASPNTTPIHSDSRSIPSHSTEVVRFLGSASTASIGSSSFIDKDGVHSLTR